MRAKQLIASSIFVFILSIRAEAQFLSFNTVPARSQQNVYTVASASANNNVVRTQPQRRSQTNIRVSRQKPFVQQQQQPIRTRPVQSSEVDTIIIIETEPLRQQPKPTQRQTIRQPQIQQPQRQQQTLQPQRQQQTQQTQRQQQIQQPQSQQQQVQQQQYYQQSQDQRPIHGDAPVVFPGSTNRPRPIQPSVGFTKPNSPFLAPTTAVSPLSFVGNSDNFGNIAGNSGLNSFSGSAASFPNVATSNSNSFGATPAKGFTPETPLGPTATFGNGADSGFVDAASPIGLDQSNGYDIGATANPNSFGYSNGFDNIPAAANLNPVNNFAGGGNNGGPFDQRYNPHRPQGNYYRNFAAIFNDIDQKAETDYNTADEDDWVNDDFNGRSVVSPGQYPHMAALGYRTSTGETEFKCGGSLISEVFVLTAAHCCFLNGQAPHLVKIGDIKLKEFEHDIEPQRRGIARVHKHPYYNTSMHYHDIGLLELTNPIEYTFFVRPIRLWARDEIPYSKVFTMGYGSTSFAQAPTNVLTELDLLIVPLETCNQSMPSDQNAPEGIVESQICAKDFEKNRDTCQGDSGGPLQLNLERPRRRRLRYYLVGVISYGTFCRSSYPGVYTRVSSYIDWIASIVWPTYFNNFQ